MSASSQRSPAPTGARIGGHILADALVGHGVDTIFGVPGESYLALLDGLYRHRDECRLVICRQEGGAAFMADAYAKLTGKPSVVAVTRGPGATNAAIGIHTAFQDSTPMIVLVGQVGSDFADREAFQEIDYRRMFDQMAKWTAQIERAERIPEYVAHAFQVATSGRMGPVVLALPEDMLASAAEAPATGAFTPVRAAPSSVQISRLHALLGVARRPLVLLGGSGWTASACDDLRMFAHANDLPVACAFRFQDLLANDDPHYVGDVGVGVNPKLATRIREADLVLAIGPRLGEMTTSGYTLFQSPVPRQTLVHVHGGAEELGSVYQAALMIQSGMPEFAAAVRNLKVDSSAWAGTREAARADYVAWQARPPVFDTSEKAARVDLWQVVRKLQAALPGDTIVTNGAGNFSTWAHRFWRYGGLRSQLAPTSGAMGYGMPAAVAAAISAPDRTVVCFAGDGDFLMTAQELATAVRHEAPFLTLVFNNGIYGTIRMHQEREYPARVHGSSLTNPDFVKFIESFGGFGVTVTETAQFDDALARALAFMEKERRPALIDLRIDEQVITPGRSLDQVRAGS